MSLLTRKHPVDDVVGVRDRALQSAQRAVPAAKNAIPKAKQAVPLAKNAGTAVRRSAEDASTAVRRSAEDAAAWARPMVDDAAAWARPMVDDARSWAAPRLERSGLAVQDSIAPAISEAMISAARKLETKPVRKRRRWAGVVAVTMLLAAAASAATALAMRRRPVVVGYAPADIDPDDITSPNSPDGQHLAEADGSQPDTEVNGQSRES